MKKILIFLVMIMFLLSLSSCDLFKIENNDSVVINEICTNNGSLATVDNDYIDWIELYNPTSSDIFLKNYGISDDRTNLYKYIFPSVYIKAKSYLIVYFEKDTNSNEELLGNFGLSNNGEVIYFTMPNKTILEEITVPELGLNTTYGRYNKNGVETFEVLNPTPNMKNESKPIYKHINTPIFSNESGFYNSSFDLTISSDEDVKIYYTLDCSIPTTKSTLYEGSIKIEDPSNNPNVLKSRNDMSVFKNNNISPVDKMVVVRAIAVSIDGNQSEVVTKNYFVGKNKYKDDKIISLVTDSFNLVDDKYGIYVKGKAYNDYVASGSVGEAPDYNWDMEGRVSERDCNLTYLNDGDFSLNQDCGMRIHGYGGRSILYKSFNIYARSCYGEKYFLDPLFKNTTLTKSFILKYDRYSPSNEKFRDGFVQSLVKDRDIATQEYEQCILFLNGEYWQTYSMMQKYSDDYLYDTYKVDKNNVTIIKDDKLDVGNNSGYNEYKELKSFVKNNNFKNQDNYEKFCNLVDVDSLIDYYAIQLYINNFDFSYRKNYLLWRTNKAEENEYGDTRWRFMLYDLDYVATEAVLTKDELTVTYDYKFDPFTGDFLYATDFKNDIFIHKLMANEEFKEKFVTAFLDIANNNLSKENVRNKVLEEYNISSGKLTTFFGNRFIYIKDHLAKYLKVNNEVANVVIETDKEVKFNTIMIDSNYSGCYLKAFPITLYNVDIDSCELTDLEVIKDSSGVIKLKITGDSPKIVIND